MVSRKYFLIVWSGLNAIDTTGYIIVLCAQDVTPNPKQ